VSIYARESGAGGLTNLCCGRGGPRKRWSAGGAITKPLEKNTNKRESAGYGLHTGRRRKTFFKLVKPAKWFLTGPRLLAEAWTKKDRDFWPVEKLFLGNDDVIQCDGQWLGATRGTKKDKVLGRGGRGGKGRRSKIVSTAKKGIQRAGYKRMTK